MEDTIASGPKGNPKSIKEGVREAALDESGAHLRDDTPDEKGKPEAVNLEREEPVTNAARRRDSF